MEFFQERASSWRAMPIINLTKNIKWAIMDEISNLMEQAVGKGPRAQKATLRLAALGMHAAPAIIASIRAREKEPVWNLRKALLQIRDPDIVPVFIELIGDSNSNLALTAFEALGRLKDTRAFKPLSHCLLDSTEWGSRRALAAEALGDLGATQAVERLLNVAREILQQPDVAPAISESSIPENVEIDEDSLQFVLSIAIALAKLGNHEMVSTVKALTHYRSEDVYSADEVIRAKAAKALQYVVGPGVFPTLKGALNDDYFEARLESIDAMFYLGIKEGIDELMQRAKDESSSASNNAFVRLWGLTGQSFDRSLSVTQLQEWRLRNESSYSAGICYRLGKPIWLPDVIVLLETPRLRDQVVRELKIITGEDFGYNPYVPPEDQDNIFERAQAWWEKEGARFEAGGLYKYGYKQDISSIF
jgi:HEAT repeat protein